PQSRLFLYDYRHVVKENAVLWNDQVKRQDSSNLNVDGGCVRVALFNLHPSIVQEGDRAAQIQAQLVAMQIVRHRQGRGQIRGIKIKIDVRGEDGTIFSFADVAVNQFHRLPTGVFLEAHTHHLRARWVGRQLNSNCLGVYGNGAGD